MTTKQTLTKLLCCLIVIISSCKPSNKKENNNSIVKEDKKPNIVIVFLDDSGFADFSPFANSDVPTPNVQKLADEGTIFTNFHVPQAICSASDSLRRFSSS